MVAKCCFFLLHKQTSKKKHRVATSPRFKKEATRKTNILQPVWSKRNMNLTTVRANSYKKDIGSTTLARCNTVQEAVDAIARGEDAFEIDENGCGLLHFFARSEASHSLELLFFFATRCLTVNLQTVHGCLTPLHLVAMCGSLEHPHTLVKIAVLSWFGGYFHPDRFFGRYSTPYEKWRLREGASHFAYHLANVALRLGAKFARDHYDFTTWYKDVYPKLEDTARAERALYDKRIEALCQLIASESRHAPPAAGASQS